MNISSAENFMRSAKAPVISAGVMMAKVIWNMMKTLSGIVGAISLTLTLPASFANSMPFSSTRSSPPI
ncbi:hypothetical protein D3C74_506040 [compost metagenome]